MTAGQTEPRATDPCRWVRDHLDTYLDGELAPAQQAEFDRHLDGCAPCGEDAAFRESVRRQLREAMSDPVEAPPALRQRLLLALDAEDGQRSVGGVRGLSSAWFGRDQPAAAAAGSDGGWARPLGPPAAATALVAMAGLGLLVGSGEDGSRIVPRRSAAVSSNAGVVQGPNRSRRAALPEVIEDAVRVHESALPADVRSSRPDHLERYVQPRIPFTAPLVRLEGARAVGARLILMNGRNVPAYFYRRPDGQRVTVVVLDRHGVEAGAGRPARVSSRRVGDRPVQVLEEGNRLYILTADLPERELAELAAGARIP